MSPSLWRAGAVFIGAVLFSVFLFSSSLEAAAPTGTLRGWVEDAATGERLPGAAVAVIGTTRGDVTDNDGAFAILELPAGTYSVRVSLIGYGPRVATDVVVAPRRPAELIMELSPAVIELDDAVTVRPGFFTRPSNAEGVPNCKRARKSAGCRVVLRTSYGRRRISPVWRL